MAFTKGNTQVNRHTPINILVINILAVTRRPRPANPTNIVNRKVWMFRCLEVCV